MVWLQKDGNIFGQIYINDGTKFNSKFQINTNFNLLQEYLSIKTLKNNNFIVSWDVKYNVYAQIFTDNGTKVGSQLNIISGNSTFSSITSLVNGNFVVTYVYLARNIFAQIFYINGTLLKGEFLVHTYINRDNQPSISSISTSNFMIVWQSQGQDIIGGSDYGIYGQSFTSSGAKIGDEFRINTCIISDQTYPSIQSLVNDNYIVTWQSNNQDGSYWGIYGQILDSNGNKIGKEFKVNTYTYTNQDSPSVTSLINTNCVVVWENNVQDGNGHGIFGNIYQSDGSIIGFDTCPLNCQSCENKTNCIICNPNFQLQQSGICGCLNGFFLDNTYDNLCFSNFSFINLI